MPLNKSARERYRIIDSCLTKKGFATITKLVKECNDRLIGKVSESTIKKDIAYLRREFNAEIYWKKGSGYTYVDPNYSIEKLPVNEDDIIGLAYIEKMLQQYPNAGILKNVKRTIENVRKSLRARIHYQEQLNSASLEFDKRKTDGQSNLQPLLRAIMEEEVVKIGYRPFGSRINNTRTVSPYMLKEYSHRWYLIGYSEESRDMRTYALDRIKSVSRHYKSFNKRLFNPENYFDDVYGITRFKESKKQQIELKFSRHQADYVLTQPLHKSQKVIRETKDHVIVSLEVYLPSPELEIKILGWNEEVEVLEPEGLRVKIKEKLERAMKQYNYKQ